MENKKDIKVGILTYSQITNLNYGAMLQCFALYHALEKLGFKPYVIDWNIKKKIRTYSIDAKPNSSWFTYGLLHLKRFVNYQLYLTNRRLSLLMGQSKFKRFSFQYLPNKTNKVNLTNISSLNNQLDCFIVGSDQVWRYNYCPNIETFFFDFVEDNKPKIAYAASFGIDQWNEAPNTTTENLKKLINRFKSVSVREKSGLHICRTVFEKSASHVLDPTFLHTQEEYIKKFDLNNLNKKNLRKHYIGYFFLNTDREIFIQKQMQKINKSTIIDLSGNKFFLLGFKIHRFNTIPEWLNYIRHADFIITDSFHCTAFCIIFKKRFAVISDESRGSSRLHSLLSDFQLENRLFKNKEELVTNIDFESEIDYLSISNTIQKKYSESISFLLSSLSLTPQVP